MQRARALETERPRPPERSEARFDAALACLEALPRRFESGTAALPRGVDNRMTMTMAMTSVAVRYAAGT